MIQESVRDRIMRKRAAYDRQRKYKSFLWRAKCAYKGIDLVMIRYMPKEWELVKKIVLGIVTVVGMLIMMGVGGITHP